VSCVEETKLVVRAVAPRLTCVPGTKLTPVTAMIAGEVLATSEDGETDVIEGVAFSTTKFAAFDAPPPGAGFVTTIR
jgi:hypothetical protein